jgi:hypothetical protein
MSTYFLPDNTKSQKKKNIFKLLPMILLAGLPAIIFGYFTSRDIPCVFPVFLILTVSVIVIAFIIGINRRFSVKIITDNDQITYQRSGKPDVRIRRDEIKKIIEIRDSGLRIKSNDPTEEIFASKNLVFYDQLKNELSSWASIENAEQGKSPQKLIIAYLLWMAAITLLTFTLRRRVLFYIWVASLVLPVLYHYALDIKSIFVTKDSKKRIQLILVYSFIAYLIYRLLFN